MKKLLRLVSAVCVVFAALFSLRSVCFADGIELTPEEEEYISSHESVKIGYVRDRIPISFETDNGEFGGISRHIIDHISSVTGLNFDYVPLPTGDVTYDYLLNGGFDLVSSVEYNKENQAARGILMSDPYLSSRKVVVARNGLEFRYDAELSIAISTGSQTIKKVLGEAYPNFKIVDYPSTSACFDAVNEGGADLMIQNQYVAEYWMSKPIYEKMKVIPVLGLDDQLCFSAVVAFGGGEGTPPEEGRVLINILDKAIDNMTGDEVGSFTIQGIMENQYKYTISDVLYRYRYAASALAALMAIILVLGALLIRQHIRIAESKADAKVKKQFLSTMSHEIRTPLNGLIGLNYLMSRTADDTERMRDYLKQSTMTAKYLLSLVNDMLDMSNLQNDNLELVLRPVDLQLVFGTVSSIAESAMSDKGIKYTSECDLKYPYVICDEVRIQQVVLNLLDNSRKFTKNGGSVTLGVTQEMTKDGKALTSVTVTDNGKGMSEEFQKHIFDAFAQELDTVSKGNQGTGLGLPISRRLAMLMGGDLTFESRKGEGSAFKFTFTASVTDKSETKNILEEEAGSVRPKILVAEDNELNGEIITELLRENGFETELAENGKVALEKFKNSSVGEFGIILMDLLMPEMDGFEAAETIRALDRSDAKTVKIFACSANLLSEERRKTVECEMNGFFEKPINIDELLKKINE